MRPLDLRDKDNSETLDPLAHFKLLSIMFYPNCKSSREKMMSSVRNENGENKLRVGPFTRDKSKFEQKLHSSRGRLVGFLLMTRAQLFLNGFSSSLTNAIKIAQHELPEWTEADSTDWKPENRHEHNPRSKRILSDCYSTYISVSFLWAAALHEQQHARDDILPIVKDRIPLFLGYAEEFRCIQDRMAKKFPGENVKYRKAEKWHFTLPDGIKIKKELKAEPLKQGWEAIIKK